MDISSIKNANIPKHVAIIMDGNGRWAKNKNLPRIAGHTKGVRTVREIVEIASIININALTLFTFSSENWQRPSKEVSSLMKLLVTSIKKELNALVKNNIKFECIGDLNSMDPAVVYEIDDAIKKTSHNNGMILTLALSYGSRQELLNAFKALYLDINKGYKHIDAITEKDISKYLYTSKIGDPDLLIRTGGDYRVSNFLLWQIAYAELIISNKFWPDFSKEDFISTIEEFQSRDRRYGGLKN